MWPFEDNSDDAFRNTVRQEFSPLADECGATLKQIEPFIFGFVTDYAVLTGAYPGHFRGICVKLRRRENQEPLSVITKQVGLSFITSPKADWVGLRTFVDAKIEQAMREQPWLKKYSRNND